MKFWLLIVLSFTLLVGCTSTPTDRVSNKEPDAFISTMFSDEGLKLTYSLLGKLKSVEVFGQAEIWRGNFEAVAEADALAKLTKFTYGTVVETSRRVDLIG